ncbi:MAG: rhodanese-like domain-containing protein [Cyanobacteria bacterium J06621_11]
MGCSIDSSRGWIGSSPQVTQRELLSQIESDTAPVILDVRTPEEYAAGHVPGAINIHFQEIESRLDEIVVPNEDSIVIYCERGIRANKAEDALYAAGFESVFHLAGDMSNWRRNGLLIEQED